MMAAEALKGGGGAGDAGRYKRYAALGSNHAQKSKNVSVSCVAKDLPRNLMCSLGYVSCPGCGASYLGNNLNIPNSLA